MTRVRIGSRSITQAVTVVVMAEEKEISKPTPVGISFVQRNAAPYPWGATEREMIYAAGVPTVRVNVEDRVGTETTQVFAQSFDTSSNQTIQLPGLPPLTSSPDHGLAVKRVLYATGGSFAITNLIEQAESYLTHWSVAARSISIPIRISLHRSTALSLASFRDGRKYKPTANMSWI